MQGGLLLRGFSKLAYYRPLRLHITEIKRIFEEKNQHSPVSIRRSSETPEMKLLVMLRPPHVPYAHPTLPEHRERP